VKTLYEISSLLFYPLTCTHALAHTEDFPKISEENWRANTIAPNNENCVYKHGSKNASVTK
jgi:hypothetical protein